MLVRVLSCFPAIWIRPCHNFALEVNKREESMEKAFRFSGWCLRTLLTCCCASCCRSYQISTRAVLLCFDRSSNCLSNQMMFMETRNFWRPSFRLETHLQEKVSDTWASVFSRTLPESDSSVRTFCAVKRTLQDTACLLCIWRQSKSQRRLGIKQLELHSY